MTGFRRAGTVVFDCDSTLSRIEGVEELSREHRGAVEELTRQAMDGQLPLEAVYGRRLALVRPDRGAIAALGARYLETLVPDARETVAVLRAEGIDVRIISGGLLPAVRAVAEALGVPADAVAAVPICFAADGTYAGYDIASPLARAGGKLEVLRRWRQRAALPMMLVGDGATDLEARPAVDIFVAFAGVVERPSVVAAADAVVRAPSLAPIVPIALAGEPPASATGRSLFEKGVALLDDELRTALVQNRIVKR